MNPFELMGVEQVCVQEKKKEKKKKERRKE
jgi:hypothetical protein